jgi:undecaprenyl-diphosphatase
MESLNMFSAIILGIVEGLTEFIPVSSTGHMILVGEFLKFKGEKAEVFEVFIQLGAILAVAIISRDRFRNLLDFRSTLNLSGFRGCLRIFLTTAPALVVGAILHGVIKQRLFNPLTVMIGLAVGGVAILLVERFLRQKKGKEMETLTPVQALAIGCTQCLSLWPGMSRSACTIMGGMIFGLSRRAAVDYSFLAAVPVMSAAVTYDLWKSRHILTWSDAPIFAVGFAVSFLVALLAIRFFMGLLATWDLRPFGYYRIAAASAGALWFLLHHTNTALR